MRPVTQVAEVAVNRAVPNEEQMPLRDEIGSISSAVPTAIKHANPRMTIWNEEGLFRFARTDNVACSFSCVAQLESIAERLVPDVS
jgi:hypothetical protein